jgi:sugar lactone lactonase YvrE
MATGAVTTLAGSSSDPAAIQDGTGAGARFQQLGGITSDGAGNLFVTDNVIRQIVAATGVVTTLSNGPGRDPGASPPTGITSDGAGSLFFIESGLAIWKVATASGNLNAIAGAAGQYGAMDGTGAVASFYGANGIVGDGAGNLYVADTNNYTIRKVVIATRAVTTLAGAAGQAGTVDGQGTAAHFSNPAGIAFDGAGHLFVADGNTIRKVTIATATVSTVVGAADSYGVLLGPLPASLSQASALVVLPTGDLAIVDTLENSVLLARF